MSKKTKSTAGRIAGFTPSKLKGVGLPDMIDAATYGDIALTEGGTRVRQAQNAYLSRRNDAWEFEAELIVGKVAPQWVKDIAAGLVPRTGIRLPRVSSEARFFSEVSEFLAAQHRSIAEGPLAPAYYYAGRFIWMCELAERGGGTRGHLYILPAVASVKLAMGRKRFRPTVAEIADHLSEVMEDPPTYKQVERIAEVLGSKKPAEKSDYGSKSGYRQFWEW
jgi:hypothetical protein